MINEEGLLKFIDLIIQELKNDPMNYDRYVKAINDGQIIAYESLKRQIEYYKNE